MHNITETSSRLPHTVLGRVGLDPARLITIRDWWREMGEPCDLLFDPEATFRSEEAKLIALCRSNAIAYRLATANAEAAFPIWLCHEAAAT